jgi:AcrR family transcriptional regulator
MTATPSASRTARERARAELTREIKQEARRQLAASGAQGLSLRAVARELGMVSSAIYRYFPSRDELLTALIIDAYNALGEAAEAADSGVPADSGGAVDPGVAVDSGVAAADVRGRWRAVCGAIRAWALAHPHEYALIYGSPVPGYQAPRATVASAIRVVRVMGGILADAGAIDDAPPVVPPLLASPLPPVRSWPLAPPLPAPLAEQAASVADAIAPGVPGPVIARALIAWTQLFGMISFELFGQFVGSFEPADPFVAFTAEQMADFIGLPAREFHDLGS